MNENVYVSLSIFIQASRCQATNACHESWCCLNQVSFIFFKVYRSYNGHFPPAVIKNAYLT